MPGHSLKGALVKVAQFYGTLFREFSQLVLLVESLKNQTDLDESQLNGR